MNNKTLLIIIIIVVIVAIGVYYHKRKSAYKAMVNIYSNVFKKAFDNIKNISIENKEAIWDDLNNDFNAAAGFIQKNVNPNDITIVTKGIYDGRQIIRRIFLSMAPCEKEKLQTIAMNIMGILNKYASKFPAVSEAFIDILNSPEDIVQYLGFYYTNFMMKTGDDGKGSLPGMKGATLLAKANYGQYVFLSVDF